MINFIKAFFRRGFYYKKIRPDFWVVFHNRQLVKTNLSSEKECKDFLKIRFDLD